MKIYFFRSNGDSYEQMALIEGTASSIYSITYYDLDGDGRREILVGFKSGTELQVLAVYTLRGSEPLNLLTTAYLRYAVSDLDGDGRQELTVLYSGEENRCMADCYTWDDRERAASRRSSCPSLRPSFRAWRRALFRTGSRRSTSPAWRTTAWRPTIS